MNRFFDIIKAFAIMISLYTRIPVPMVAWNERNLRYVLCLLPFAGAITGICVILLFLISAAAGISAVLFAALVCALVVLVTGGIHMDGFADTMDAKNSFGSREKKWAILEDPHTGAFAVTWTALYLLLLFACMYELYSIACTEAAWKHLPVTILAVFMLSRALTGLAIAVTVNARQEGMLYEVSALADKKLLILTSSVIIAVCSAAIIASAGLPGLMIIPLILLIFILFRRMAIREFGGISGDLCGWLIKLSELLIFLAVALLLRVFVA